MKPPNIRSHPHLVKADNLRKRWNTGQIFFFLPACKFNLWLAKRELHSKPYKAYTTIFQPNKKSLNKDQDCPVEGRRNTSINTIEEQHNVTTINKKFKKKASNCRGDPGRGNSLDSGDKQRTHREYRWSTCFLDWNPIKTQRTPGSQLAKLLPKPHPSK